MKYTLCITQECNLACSYCYIPKRPRVMSLETARDAVDFIFRQAAGMDQFEIGFFGGEPLLEFELIREVTPFIKSRPGFDKHPSASRSSPTERIFRHHRGIPDRSRYRFA
jgi:uncharacterized protein